MSQEGNWADALIIQAVTDCLNLKINITESNQNFGDRTVINQVNSSGVPTTIFLASQPASESVSE